MTNRNTVITVVIGFILLILILYILQFGAMGNYHMGPMMWGGLGFAMMLLGWIFWILVLALLVLGIVWLVRNMSK